MINSYLENVSSKCYLDISNVFYKAAKRTGRTSE